MATLPRQQLSFSQKGKEWRKQHLDWAEDQLSRLDSPIRTSFYNKKVNADLVAGIINMKDIVRVLEPNQDGEESFDIEPIQHFPIINSKLNLLRGEESKRTFSPKIVVTNPEAVSIVEENKKKMVMERTQQIIETLETEEDIERELEKLKAYADFDWKDLIELRANVIYKHYSNELSFGIKFNTGFMNALSFGEEAYICDIVSGEPTLEVINTCNMHIFMSGYSNKIEDADFIMLVDYWSLGKIIDTFYDELTPKEIKDLESVITKGYSSSYDEMGNISEKDSYVLLDETISSSLVMDNYISSAPNFLAASTPIDANSNLRIIRLYWKSRRAIKKVTSFDFETGEPIINFYSEEYVINPALGETEKLLWINEAWEGTKIGKDKYIAMRPRAIQYNRMNNPSRCHFGIVGTIYNTGDNKPFSVVDMMKPFSYTYDVIHDRLNKLIANNWGRLLKVNLASIPDKWEIEKWLYYAKVHNIAVEDGFKEGNRGPAKGKLAGNLGNSTSGVLDGETGDQIQHYINLLEFIKLEMGEVVGISRQREGQVSNRETVGGVERATLQSNHTTEWLFMTHDDTRKRAVECFLETAKFAWKGKSKKMAYLLPNGATSLIDIDGDEFSMNDYGLLLDVSPQAQQQAQNLLNLANNALAGNKLSFSSIIKIWNSASLAEVQRTIEKEEQLVQEREAQQAEANNKILQEQQAMELEFRQQQLELENALNERDNKYKLLIAQLGKESTDDNDGIVTNTERERLREDIRRFNEEMAFKRQKLREELQIKREQLHQKKNSSNK